MNASAELRFRLLAVLVGSSTLACGGATSDGLSSGGAGGTGGTTGGAGGSTTTGGTGGFVAGGTGGTTGGFGGVSTGGASTGGASTGGFGGVSTGGVGGAAGTAGVGGTSGGAGGSAGFGGIGGSSGAGGAGGGLITYGEVQCDAWCEGKTWDSCWPEGQVPVWPGVPMSNACPGAHEVDNQSYPLCGPGEVWFYDSQKKVPGMCCYTTEPQCLVGRPFVVAGEQRLAPAAARGDWGSHVLAMDEAEIDSATREQLHAVWLDDARQEHASVAAFAQLTLQLLALGAPPELLAASQVAGADEVRHAQGCFALASRFGSGLVGPGPLPVNGALDSIDLVSVAVATFEEGCVGETVAALLATEMRGHARDTQVVTLLNAIAEEEAQHAELAWSIVRWAVQLGGDNVKSAIACKLAEMQRVIHTRAAAEFEGDVEAWHAFGRLTPREALSVEREALDAVIAPCVDQLLASPSAARPSPVLSAQLS